MSEIFPLSTILTGAVILIAAFLGSWLALSLSARRNASPVPQIEEPEADSQSHQPEAKVSREYPFKHAFDFSNDQVTMILEMPTLMLQDDAALADAWVDVVGWARMAWQDIEEGNLPVSANTPISEENESVDESEITREHLESSLQRLHDAAERRRALRLKLAEHNNSVQETGPTA